MHKKISKVVKRIKKSEMPSIPKVKFKFKKGIHNIWLTNWKEPIDLLKKTHKNREVTYDIQDTFKAMDFNNEWFEAGTNNKKKVPINGNTRINTSELDMFNKKKSTLTFYRTWTYAHQLRRLLLYPTELKMLKKLKSDLNRY